MAALDQTHLVHILPPPSPTLQAQEPSGVYELIHSLHNEILESIDSSLSWDELTAPSANYAFTRPIIEKFAPHGTDSNEARASLGAVLYACMANRIQFQELADNDLSYKPLQETRAEFCELLAIKFLRTFPNPNDEEELASQLVRQWCALDGATEDVWKRVEDRDEAAACKSSALDISIVASAKRFVAQPVVQHILQEIGSGTLTYAPQQTVSLISDTYVAPRHRRSRANSADGDGTDEAGDSLIAAEIEARGHDVEVYAYNPYRAGWLDYGRLRVPKWRHVIEFATFAILIFLFCITLTNRSLGHVTGLEIFFIIFTFGFILDEFASIRGSGLHVYLSNAWNGFDLAYIAVFLTYLVLRISARIHHNKDESDFAFDVLACGACFLFPRLIFFFLKNNAVILSLQGMIATFVGFMIMISIAFTGIGFTLWRLGTPRVDVPRVAKMMIKIWFGKGWTQTDVEDLQSTLAPVVLTVFAFMCSTMLFSMMVSMMSAKFAAVQHNAQQEYLFQRAVNTLEGVRADSVFCYLPPSNIIAVLILGPLGLILQPDTMHNLNVMCIQITNFPILVAISAYERQQYRNKRRALRLTERGLHPKKVAKSSIIGTFLGGESTVIRAAFDLAPPVKIDPPGTPTKDIERGAAELKPPKPERPEGQRNANTLSRLFNVTPKRQRSGSVNAATERTVTVSAEEWEHMRESQARLEALLQTFMAASGIEPNPKPKTPERKVSPEKPKKEGE